MVAERHFAWVTAQTTLTDADYLALGRKYYDWFVSAEADSLVAHLSAGAQERAGGVDGVNRAIVEFLNLAGVEGEIVEEKMTRRNGRPQYWRESRYAAFTEESLVFRWVFTEAGDLDGVGMGPRSRTPAPD
ncbi:MAG: hypothetical protein IPI38_18520 [Gemmatimonadetes bacterium]|nr:hypothetical protein [Gemmatimonadota bacterium]MBP6669571.1 hypothetical protein [Gemmatimonadales bacterium]